MKGNERGLGGRMHASPLNALRSRREPYGSCFHRANPITSMAVVTPGRLCLRVQAMINEAMNHPWMTKVTIKGGEIIGDAEAYTDMLKHIKDWLPDLVCVACLLACISNTQS
jgi:hypothetical protein